MNIVLYVNSAEKIRVNKENYLTQVLSLEGTLRKECNIISPSILVQSTELPTFNYVYIEDFNRYYFVDNVVSIRYGLWQINMTEDVLMSFKNEYLDLPAYINRNQFNYDGFINDSLYPIRSNTKFDIIQGPAFAPNFDPASYNETYSFIVCISNASTNNDYTSNEDFNQAQIGDIITPLPITRPFCPFFERYLMSYFEFIKFCAWVKQDSTTRAPFVISVTAYSIDILKFINNPRDDEPPIGLTYSDTVTLGVSEVYTKKTSSYIYHIDRAIRNVCHIGSVSVPFKFNNFMDYDPYTKISIWLPNYGFADVETYRVIGKNISITAILDFDNATITYYLATTQSPTPFFTGSSSIGYNIPVTATNFGDIQRQTKANQMERDTAMMQGALQGMSGLVGGATTVGKAGMFSATKMGGAILGSAGVGAIGGAVQGGLQFLSTAIGANANYEAKETLNVQRSYTNGGINSDSVNYFYRENIVVIRYYVEPAITTDEDINAYAKLFGRPLEKVKTLSELSGITTVGEIRLDGLTCMKDEVDLLYNNLVNGIIL